MIQVNPNQLRLFEPPPPKLKLVVDNPDRPDLKVLWEPPDAA